MSTFIESFEARIRADEAVLGDSLKVALHNLEVQAAKVVAACIQQHDATPLAQALHATIDALKKAGLQAEKDVLGLLGSDAKADVPQIEQAAVAVGSVVAADVAAKKTNEIIPDALKAVEGSSLAGTAATQAADAVAKAATDVVDAAQTLDTGK